MLSQPNINVEKLKQLLEGMLETLNHKDTYLYGGRSLIDQAFPPQPKEEWRPKEGKKVYYVNLINDEVWEIIFSPGWQREFKISLIYPTKESAEAFLVKYKEWLKTI